MGHKIGQAQKCRKYYASVSKLMSRANNHLGSLVKSGPYSVCSLWTVCPDFFCPWAHLCVFKKFHSIHRKIFLNAFIFIQVNISPSIIWPFLIPFVRKRKKIVKAWAPAGNSSPNAWLCAEIAFEIHFIKHEPLFICNDSFLYHAQTSKWIELCFIPRWIENCHTHLLGKKRIKTIKRMRYL